MKGKTKITILSILLLVTLVMGFIDVTATTNKDMVDDKINKYFEGKSQYDIDSVINRYVESKYTRGKIFIELSYFEKKLYSYSSNPFINGQFYKSE